MHTTPVSLLYRLRQPQSQEAWPRFVELYAPLLFRWTRRFGLQEADAADLVQDVFVVLLRKLPEFVYEPGKSFRAWLWTVVRNHWRAWVRRKQTAPTIVPGADPNALPAVDRLGELEEGEYRGHVIAQALRLLELDFEPVTWQAFRKYALEGQAAAVVATELGVTVNAVHLAKSRVLRRLRGELAGLLG